MIPFVDLRAQYNSVKAEVDSAIQNVLESSAFIRGPAVQEFEAAFGAAVGSTHVLGVASGTDALFLAVRALGIGAGDEVVTVVNTWISTSFAADFCGARPVLVDIDPRTYQMDPGALERAITSKTRAVIPVHLYGHPAPMPQIVEICRSRGIAIIEDVAQAPLAEIDGRRVGTFGDIACYSFYPSKNLGCYGDGGAVATEDPKLAEKLRQLADYGQAARFDHRVVGYNSRLDTIQAAILNVKLGHISEWTAARRRNAELYRERLRGLPVVVPFESPNARAVYHVYVVQCDRRDECQKFLHERGIMSQIHYPGLIHERECYMYLGYRPGDFPVAETANGRILSLPMYAELNETQIDEVAGALRDFFSGHAS